MQKLTYSIVLRKDRPRKDGKMTLVLQAFINGDRVRIPLGAAVDPAHYDPIKMEHKAKGDLTYAQQVNTLLTKMKGKANEIFFDYQVNERLLSGKTFAAHFKRQQVAGDFIVFMHNEIKGNIESTNKSSVKGWLQTVNHLKQFKGKIPYGDIDLDLVKAFDAYLRKRKLDINTIAKHHRFFRKYINIANKKGKRIPNPYEQFTIKEQSKDRVYLTAAEVSGLKALYDRRELSDRLQRTLRHFLFQIGTSLRYSDLASARKSDIENGLLIFVPVKTQHVGKIVKVPISELAQQMIDDSESVNDLLFDVNAEPVMNRFLKEVAAYIGLAKVLTTHVGRHTFGYLFIAAGGQVEVLQKIMGHSDIKTTMVYTHIDTKLIRAGVAQINSLLSTTVLE